MADGFMVIEQNGDNYGPFRTRDEAQQFSMFLCCGHEARCDIVPVILTEEDWNNELFD
jgi:hypothetical protein